jgi:hypothetical protein
MSNRDIAINVIQKLPPGASLHDMARELELIAAAREGYEDLQRADAASSKKAQIKPPLVPLVTEAELRACYEDPEEIQLLNRFGNESI